MKKSKSKSQMVWLPDGGNVTAVVIGIETYQDRAKGKVLPVPFAKADTKAFSAVLDTMFEPDQIHRTLVIDGQATAQSVREEVHTAICQTGPDDLFIFYYAGHGFHDGTSNAITVWDSNAHNLADTCISLRELVLDPIAESACKRSLIFIDACAEKLKGDLGSRNVASTMNAQEFTDFVTIDSYNAVFLSCRPGQKSFSHPSLGHGIWSYHLLRALKGLEHDAVDEHDIITDVSLRDYLSSAVENYVTKHLSTASRQQPQASISADRRFAIRKMPDRSVPVPPEKDFTTLSFRPDRTYFSHIETRSFDRLPGFRKGSHFIPDHVNEGSATFARGLLKAEIDEDTQEVYTLAKAAFGLRRRDADHGDGSLDTPHFRYWFDVKQAPDDPSEIQIWRCLVIREGAEAKLGLLEELFGARFDRFVCEIANASGPHYNTIVDQLEDMVEAHGGEVEEETAAQRVTYELPDMGRVEFDLKERRVSLLAGRKMQLGDLLEFVRPLSLGQTHDPIRYLEAE